MGIEVDEPSRDHGAIRKDHPGRGICRHAGRDRDRRNDRCCRQQHGHDRYGDSVISQYVDSSSLSSKAAVDEAGAGTAG